MVAWESQWHSSTGVGTIDLTLDVQTITLGTAATVEVKPALQYASVRTDRPSAGGAISGGGVSAAGRTHYQESPSITDQFFFRRGVSYKLTAGSIARVQGLVYGAWISKGLVLPTDEIVFQPVNETATVSVYALGGGKPIPATGASKAKAAIIAMGNINSDLEWQLFARGFNDPLARGDWDPIDQGGWQPASSGNFEVNSDEIDFDGMTLTDFQWIELAFGVRKGSNGDPNSRCIFYVTGAVRYT
jgi:hypothetical protein